MNYIFLDIDGVLNSERYVIQAHDRKNMPRIERHFDQKAFKRLSIICKKNNAKIILSSSWRMGFSNNLIPNKEDAYSTKLLEYFNKYNIELVDITTLDSLDRGVQIKKYITSHFTSEDCYVVIDDEIQNITPYICKKNVIATDYKKGLLNRHIHIANKIFKRQKKGNK